MEKSRRRGVALYDRGRVRQHRAMTASVSCRSNPLIGSMRWLARAGGIVIGLLIAIALPGKSLPLDIHVGLGGVFVPGLPTPVSLSANPAEVRVDGAEWLVEQQVGDPWRGEALMQHRFPVEGPELDTVIPIYDFTYPLIVRLIGANGDSAPLVETELNLRPLRVSVPYAVTVGNWPGVRLLDQEEQRIADVGVSDLPDRWWGFAGVSTIWVGTTPSAIPTGIWEAIEQWVMCGGRLVLSTGTSFYLIDSPELRRLLPLRSPVLIEGRLSGDLKAGAEVWQAPSADGQTAERGSGEEQARTSAAAIAAASSDRTAAIIVSQRYGAGLVVAVDRRADEVSDETILELLAVLDAHPYVPPTEWLSEAGDLGTMSLQRPGYPTTIAMALLILVGLLWVVFGVRPAGWKRLVGLGIVLGVAVVLSGLHVNVPNQARAIYSESTVIQIEGTVGIRLDHLELFAFASADSTIPPPWLEEQVDPQRRPRTAVEEGVAVQVLPLELAGVRWDATWIPEAGAGLAVHVDRGETREIVFMGEAIRSLEAAYTGDERLSVSNPGSALTWAIAAVDGEFYDLGGLPAGHSTIQLEGALLPGASAWDEALERIGAELESRFRLDEGAWLIAGTAELTDEQWGQARTKVRHTEVHVVVAEPAD